LTSTTHLPGTRWLVRDAPDAQPFAIAIIEWSKEGDYFRYARDGAEPIWSSNPRAFSVIGALVDTPPATEIIVLNDVAEQRARGAQMLQAAAERAMNRPQAAPAQTTQSSLRELAFAPASDADQELEPEQNSVPAPPVRSPAILARFLFFDDHSIEIQVDPSLFNVGTFDGEDTTSQMRKRIVIARRSRAN